jgi:hypothetical protein
VDEVTDDSFNFVISQGHQAEAIRILKSQKASLLSTSIKQTAYELVMESNYEASTDLLRSFL